MANNTQLHELVSAAEQDNIQQLVVGAVVRHEDRVLLLKRPEDDFMGGIFELPSGKVEPGEALDEALVREVKEETGLDVSSLGMYLGSFDYGSGSGRATRQFTFAVEIPVAQPIQLQEHDDYKWVELSDDAPVTDAVKGVLARYRELCVSDDARFTGTE